MNIIAPINSLGYGVAGLNLLKSLSTKTKVSLWPISQPQVSTQEDADIAQAAMSNAQTPDWSAPCIRIWHQHDMAQFVGKGEKIGFPIFELDKFKPVEKHHLSYLDKIFVCSKWAKDVICDEIVIDPNLVFVIPLGVDSRVFSPSPIDNEQNNDTI
ncbi:MAG: glycosyltransferase family 4 protein, partial [Alteromonas macleodii]|nr:glycosyltransferase family 4 protein [Alteromonas macleodii]